MIETGKYYTHLESEREGRIMCSRTTRKDGKESTLCLVMFSTNSKDGGSMFVNSEWVESGMMVGVGK